MHDYHQSGCYVVSENVSSQPVSRPSQPASQSAIPIRSAIIRGIIHFSSIFIVRILQRNGKRKEISIPFMDEILTINRFSYFVRETKRFLIHFVETVFFMRYIVCDDQLISFRMPCRCSCPSSFPSIHPTIHSARWWSSNSKLHTTIAQTDPRPSIRCQV